MNQTVSLAQEDLEEVSDSYPLTPETLFCYTGMHACTPSSDLDEALQKSLTHNISLYLARVASLVAPSLHTAKGIPQAF